MIIEKKYLLRKYVSSLLSIEKERSIRATLTGMCRHNLEESTSRNC